MINSCTGSSGMRSSRATPPIGSERDVRVLIQTLRSECVPEFMQHHAKKKKQNKYHAARRHRGTACA